MLSRIVVLMLVGAMTCAPASVSRAQNSLADLLDQANESIAEESKSTQPPAISGGSDRPAVTGFRDTRWAIPAGDAAKAATAAVRDVFKQEFATANSPELRLGLAHTLITEAAQTTKPPEKWALLAQSLQLAIDAGSLDESERVIDQISAAFLVERDQYWLQTLTALAAKPQPDAADAIAITAIKEARANAAQGNLELAAKYLSVGQSLARKTRNQTLTTQCTELATELRAAEKSARELKGLLAKYKDDPTDPQVCLDLGRTYCFVLHEWDRGLPILAKGRDAELAALAASDQRVRGTTSAAVAAADGWLKWAQRQKGQTRAAAAGRATELYVLARDRLEGLERTRVEKKIQEAAEMDAPTGPKTWLADIPELRVSGVGLSKDGSYLGKPYACGGNACKKALRAMPGPNMSPATIVYAIPPSTKRLIGHAGVFVPEDFKKATNLKPATPLHFEIRLDGRTVWKSSPLAECNMMAAFDVVVAGGRELELVTMTENPNSAFAAWIDPAFVK